MIALFTGGFSPSMLEVIYSFAVVVISIRSPPAFSRISLKNMATLLVFSIRLMYNKDILICSQIDKYIGADHEKCI